MPNKNLEYLEDIYTREFYDFYRKTRRKVSKKINQEMLFKKAMGGLIQELFRCMEETDNGVHLRGLGVLYKKPFGQWYRKMSLFTHRKLERGINYFYLEDEYLRNRYNVKKVYRTKRKEGRKKEDKPDAVMLHRKLIRKNDISNT